MAFEVFIGASADNSGRFATASVDEKPVALNDNFSFSVGE
jgi:hypothetical protein